MPLEMNYSHKVDQLFNNQLVNWATAANNYASLNYIQTKRLHFNGFYFDVQFNPGRIISSSAKIDKESIKNRECFLCEANRPKEQQSIDFMEDFNILLNPYPIFPQHLTIVHKKHLPQLIIPQFNTMLELAKSLPDYTILYNGPKCGASAPDHFHFQAGNKGFMPLDYQIIILKNQYGLVQKRGSCNIFKIDDGIRKFILIESFEKQSVQNIFIEIYEKLQNVSGSDEEPDLNIHCYFSDKTWTLLIFPRGQHRPWQYMGQGDDNFIFSPASVDLGGILVIPRQQDFERIDNNLAEDMMKQIGPNDDFFNSINLNI
jgi:ATP adenylyltransferase/5',5'''-P-1,P-4-tetraphosphate phosphorylase II